MFKTALLKIKTFSSTCLFKKALSQSNSLMDHLIRSTFNLVSAKPRGCKKVVNDFKIEFGVNNPMMTLRVE